MAADTVPSAPPRSEASARPTAPGGPAGFHSSGVIGRASGSASNSSRPSSTADFPSTRAWCILKTMPSLPSSSRGTKIEVPQRPVAQQRLGQRVAGHRHEAVVRDGLVLGRHPRHVRAHVEPRVVDPVRLAQARRRECEPLPEPRRERKAGVDAVRNLLQRGPGTVALEGKETTPCDVHVRV